MAKIFIIAGVLLLGIGLVLLFIPNVLSWFGKLPGDISYESENSKVYIPIVSMIILSVVLSIVLNLFRR